jgi:hypothetical protein
MIRRKVACGSVLFAAFFSGACQQAATVARVSPESPAPRGNGIAAAGRVEWVAHDFEACRVRVEFPGSTVHSTTEVQTPKGTRTVETETAEPPGVDGTMVATCTSVGVSDENVETVLDVTRDSMLAAIGARLVEERPSNHARDLLFTLRGHEVRVRLVILGSGIFSLIVAPVDAFSRAAVSRFLMSPTQLPNG